MELVIFMFKLIFYCLIIIVHSLLENVWTYYYSQPLNSTLGGIHMTQTAHNFVEWANPNKNSPKWSCSGREWWFRKFLPKILSSMVENFSIPLFKPFGWFFLVVIPSIMHKVNHFTT